MNKIIKHGLRLGIVALLVGACVSAKVSEPSVCDSKSVSWSVPTLPTVPAQYQGALCSTYSATLPSVSTTVPFNFSDSITKVNDVAKNLNVAITELMIDNPDKDFNWILGVNVSVSRDTVPNDTPVPLAKYTMPEAGIGNELNVDVSMDPKTVLQYLNSGPLTLTVDLVGGGNIDACYVEKLAAMSNLTGTVHMCVSVDGDFNKSL